MVPKKKKFRANFKATKIYTSKCTEEIIGAKVKASYQHRTMEFLLAWSWMIMLTGSYSSGLELYFGCFVKFAVIVDCCWLWEQTVVYIVYSC
jgi:hypothetical protein